MEVVGPAVAEMADPEEVKRALRVAFWYKRR
jgi:hypothetical protein